MPKGELTKNYGRRCANCDDNVTSAGRRSETGLYYCTKDECRAAKQREYYARVHQPAQREDAPTLCAHCGSDLPARKARRGDHPTMRWCRRTECQRNRASVTLAQVAPIEMVNQLEFLTKAILEDFVPCPVCNEQRAIDGFVHINEYAEPCLALCGAEPKLPPKNKAVWKAVWGDRVR